MKLSSLFSFQFKYNLLLLLHRFKKLSYFKDANLDSEKNKAFFFLAADYGNLGDCAITVAQKRFIEKKSNYQVVEVPISQTAEGVVFTQRNISKNDIVVTVGGGNMGEMYDQIECLRQLVIRSFPKNRIISFPQTFDFSNSEEGKRFLDKTIKSYSCHNDLHLIAREKTSFKKMSESFSENFVHITPDIVLSLEEKNYTQRHGAVICMRSDEEKKLTSQQNDEVVKMIQHNFRDFKFYDTHIGKVRLTSEQRKTELDKIWETFRKAELVITDRLHGMIFCHITNTPALVFQNSNHKIKETYDWIKDNPNIRLIENYDYASVENAIQALSNPTENKVKLDSEYEPLINLLN